MASSVNNYITNLLSTTGDLAQLSDTLSASNSNINSQITKMQAQIALEQTALTTQFETMQAAQTTAQSQLNYLNAVANIQKSGG